MMGARIPSRQQFRIKRVCQEWLDLRTRPSLSSSHPSMDPSQFQIIISALKVIQGEGYSKGIVAYKSPFVIPDIP
jgi:hypothetical protein